MIISYLKSSFTQISAKERANVITHAIGLLLVILFCPVLLMSERVHPPWYGLVIFIIGMVFTYFSSAYFHLQTEGMIKDRWRIVDHISIFILIGSTYTPFILFHFNVPDGHTFLFVHWMIILGGILFKLIFKDKYEVFSLTLYLLLGWMVLFIYDPITQHMTDHVKLWLFVGGLSYTTGVIFYVWEKLYYHHAIWHIFVMLGSAGHYMALVNS